jgi:hypothetical protein
MKILLQNIDIKSRKRIQRLREAIVDRRWLSRQRGLRCKELPARAFYLRQELNLLSSARIIWLRIRARIETEIAPAQILS